jgi:thiol-disulfide isomerase/thioredoxin
MLNKIKHWAKEIAIMILLVIVTANLMSLYRSSHFEDKPLQLTNPTLLHAKPYYMPKEKPLLVHFWATWCPTCQIEASNIQSISESYEVLSIAVKSGSDADIQQWLNENELNYSTINDSDGFIAQSFKIGAYPTTFIYNKDGSLAFSEVGYTSTLGLWLRMWWASF